MGRGKACSENKPRRHGTEANQWKKAVREENTEIGCTVIKMQGQPKRVEPGILGLRQVVVGGVREGPVEEQKTTSGGKAFEKVSAEKELHKSKATNPGEFRGLMAGKTYW